MKRLSIFIALSLLCGWGYAQQTRSEKYNMKNTMKSCTAISTFPWTEDFEDETFPPTACWETHLILGEVSWGRNTDEDYIHTGVGSAFQKDVRSGGAHSILVAPQMTLPNEGNFQLKFWSFTHYPEDYDGTSAYSEVLISTTGNQPENFEVVKRLTIEEATASWQEITVSLVPYLGKPIYIGFKYYAEGWNHGWYIDDITVAEFPDVDVEVRAITVPAKGTNINLSATQEVTAKIRNNGVPVAANSFNVQLLLDGIVKAGETFPNALASTEEVSYTFTQTLDLSAAGTYVIQVIAKIGGDAVPANDTATITVKNVNCGDTISTFPFTEDFEDDLFPPACWTFYNVDEDEDGQGWERVTDPDVVHNGSAAAGHFYSWGEAEGWLVTPPILVPAWGYAMEFWSINNYPDYAEYNGVWISTTDNNPASFEEVKELSGEEISDEYKKITISLDEYVGKVIYIGFKYKGDDADSWFIDDFKVFNLNAYIDAEVEAIVTPLSMGMNMSTTETVKVTVKNNGGTPLTGFQLKLELDSTEVVTTEPFSNTIESMETADYTFTETLDLSKAGPHEIKVTIIASGDMDSTNDSKTKIVENMVCSNVTDLPWIPDLSEGISDCWLNIDADGDGETWYTGKLRGELVIASLSTSDSWYGRPLTPDNWLITRKLTLDGNYSLEFEVGAYDGYDFAETYSILISTTGTHFEDFTQIHKETLTGADFKKVSLSLSNYTNQSVYIAFRHWDCTGQSTLMMKNIKVWDFSKYVDGEVVAILTPNSGALTANEEVKVKLKNNGGSALSGFSLKLEVNGTVKTTEPYANAIASLDQTDYTFTEKLDLSDLTQGYEIKVSMVATDDHNPDNNSKTKKVANFGPNVNQAVELYGFQLWDDTWKGTDYDPIFVKFSSANPGNIITTSAYTFTDGANTIRAGEYHNGNLYFYTAASGLDFFPTNFVKASATTYTDITRSPITAVAYDMAYDYTTNKMYGISHNDSTYNTSLYTVDLDNGNLIEVGSLERFMYTLACDKTGQLFGVDENGNFCSINKATAAITVIGNTGVSPLFVQSMAFDHNTGRLFWAMCDADDNGNLFEIHLPTGICWNHGMLGVNAEITMLYAPIDEGPSSITKLINLNNPLKAWEQDNKLHISGLNIGERWAIYNISGKLVYQGIANSDVASVNLDIHGMYIIISGQRTVKVVY